MSRTVLAAAAALLAVAACASGPAPPTAPEATAPAMMTASAAEVAAGKRIAELRCASCHAIGPSGESRMEGAPAFRKLAERYPVTALEEAFAEGIMVGHPAMPEFKLSPEEIRALLGYLDSVQERRGV
ncbi:c-type cytochrome [bacterium]|nr:c-type cytochrome [bacterium]